MRHHRHQRDGGAGAPLSDPSFLEQLTGRRPQERGRATSARRQHKAGQLARQAQHALSLALAGECADDVLREVHVAHVVAAPDGARLLVHVTAPPDVPLEDLLARLDRAAPLLRRAVAGAITRKRVPALSFIPVAAAPAGGEVGHGA